jgi:release factor glutamine methyltransferase
MNIGTLSREIRDLFRDHGIETADLDARLLLADALGMEVSELILNSEEEAPVSACDRARAHAEKRLSGMPVGRILGSREFWGLEFRLNDQTLEPRPDTETLVESVLSRCPVEGPFRFADIGTGTGAIAISLLKERGHAICLATDISERALHCAQANAVFHGVAERFLAIRADYGDPVGAGLDWIISNPPYIRSDVVDRLDREVVEHDPRRALDGGSDGLVAYRSIVASARRCLAENGRIAVEIGYDQGEAVSALLSAAGFLDIEIIQDLAGHDRVVVAKQHKSVRN